MNDAAFALTLRITHRDGQPLPEPLPSRHFGAQGGSIGRAPQNSWVLTDPERYLSGHHATVYFDAGAFHLADCSTNGVFLNDDVQPLGRERIATLRNGDRLRLGHYAMEVAITGPGDDDATRAAAAPAPPALPSEPLDPLQLLRSPAATAAPLAAAAGPAAPARAAYAASDPWLELAPRRDAALPDGGSRVLDPLALLGGATGLGAWLPGRRSAVAAGGDGVPALGASFKPPAAVPPVPEDWLRSLVVQRPLPEPAPGAATAPRVAAGQGPAPATPVQAPSPQPCDTAAAASGTSTASTQDALALMLTAAGLDGARLPVLDEARARQALQRAGVVLREALAALRELALQRATARRRQGQALTAIAPRSNNPLKFAVRGAAEVLDGFLFGQGDACLDAEAAIAQTLAELKAQRAEDEAALRLWLRVQLDRLDPEALVRECPPGRWWLGSGSAARWALLSARHAELRRELQAHDGALSTKSAVTAADQPVSGKETSHGLA